MKETEFIKKLVLKIAEIGHNYKNIDSPPLSEVEPFKYFFDRKGNIHHKELGNLDGPWTRREILCRYLLVSAVLDQGPDIIGVRELLKSVTNSLYRKEIRIFHRPLDFFREFNISVDEIIENHNSVKKLRAHLWAKINDTSPNKYNLFFAQSQRGIVPIQQVLDYGIHRWGVPLGMILLLEKDTENKNSTQPLIEYLESFISTEIMSKYLKSHERYGLGSAIGDKACHLFAKWYVHTFNLCSKKDDGWSKWSFEVPFDSNAGRVLFRTGFLTSLATLEEYEKWEVIQKNRGKGGTHYLRITNIRGKKIQIELDDEIKEKYNEVVLKHLKIKQKPTQKVEIQIIPNAILLHTPYGIGDFDDGLIYIGTRYCFNHNNPDCNNCPLKNLCMGAKKHPQLIKDYRT